MRAIFNLSIQNDEEDEQDYIDLSLVIIGIKRFSIFRSYDIDCGDYDGFISQLENAINEASLLCSSTGIILTVSDDIILFCENKVEETSKLVSKLMNEIKYFR